jgi:hypothetical protein
MSVLDVKRTKEDFLRKKGKSSICTLRSYEHIFKSLEKFCATKYDTGLENTKDRRIEELENDMRIIKEFAKSIRKESS